MTQLRIALPLLLVLPLAGCIIPVPVPEGTPGAIQVDPGDSCGARDLRGFVGQPAAAVEGTTIVGADGTPATVRVIRPGDAVTMDFSPTRVNVRVGTDGLVESVDCG